MLLHCNPLFANQFICNLSRMFFKQLATDVCHYRLNVGSVVTSARIIYSKNSVNNPWPSTTMAPSMPVFTVIVT